MFVFKLLSNNSTMYMHTDAFLSQMKSDEYTSGQ